MGYGQRVDTVIGSLSRFLHVRSAEHDTSGDLEPYLDREVAELMPAPRHVPAVRRATPFLSGSRVTETLSWTSEHEPLCPRYAKRHRSSYASNLTAYARWMHERGKRRRSLLLYVHGWLEPGSWVEEATLMPRWYRELGVDVAHVQLPFHGRRGPRGQLFHGEWFWTADLVRSIESVRQAVCDVRSAILYFRDQGYEEIGVTGLSLGGSITMLTACVEGGPDYVVPMIAHLALTEAVEDAGILWRMKTDLERFGLDRARRKELFSRVRIGDARPVLAPERQLWVAAREDAYLRAELVARQAKAWGDPRVLWIDGGHMTFPLALDRIIDAMRAVPKLAA
ncbi:MAG: alpha/beta hydrolase family protein [Polyangiaceae bacterium]|nr:alpha/beta hydrolase family protein [Polyangiaceae bacterium]